VRGDAAISRLGPIEVVERAGGEQWECAMQHTITPVSSYYFCQSSTFGYLWARRCWWYRKYAPGDRTLEGLESEAREAKRGLWAGPQPIPPWEWRKRR
jgi:hypothetical protein